MKLGLKRKIIVVFVGVLAAVTVLDALLASYFTKRQNQEAAFATLKRDLRTWQDELQGMTLHMRTVALSAIGETVALNQLSELKALDYKLAESLSKNKEVKEAARTLAFSKSVSLNRLHLVLRSGGFSAIAVYIDGKLSHRVSVSEVGMFVQRGQRGQVWVKAAADGNGNLPIRSWPAWQEGTPPPVTSLLQPVDEPQVGFTYPAADSMLIEVAVPVEGVIDRSQQQGEGNPPELSVIDPRIAGSVGDRSVFSVNRPVTPFAVVVFQKRIDSDYLQAVERKTGMWPLLFSPDGQYSQQMGPLKLSVQQLLPNIAEASDGIKAQTVSAGQGSFYAAALPWQFERQPGFVLALVASQDSTLHNIRQTVVAILAVTGLILAFSIGIGIFWVGRIIDPIVALTDAVKAIGLVSRLERGRQSDQRLTTENLRPLAITAPGEVGELAWAFDAMIHELHSSFDTLEQRVQDRTAELHGLYQTLEEQNLQLEHQSTELSSSNSTLLEEIGERKLIEDLLRLREQEFRSLAENSPDNIARYDRDCRLTYMNSRLSETLSKIGTDCRQQLGQKPTDVGPDDLYKRYEATINSTIETGLEHEIEIELPDTGDGLRYHLVRMVAERDGSGEIIGVLAIGRDITELKRAQEQLELLNRAINQSSDAIFLIDEQLRFTYVNDTACRSLGYNREELLTMGPPDIDPDVSREHALEMMQTSQVGVNVSFESRHRTRDGLVFPVEISSSHFEDNGAIFGLAVVRDISERKKAEQRLTLLNYALDRVKQAVYLVTEDGRIRHVNQEACRALGYGYDELVGMSVPDIDSDCPPEDWLMYWNALKAEGAAKFDRYHRTKDGRIFPVEVNANYFEFDGQAYGLSLSHDISERKQYESSLLKRVQLEEQLSGLAASVPGFMFTLRVDADGHACFPFASAGIEQLFGLHPEDIRDDAAVLRARYHPQDLPRIVALTEETRRTLAPFRIEIRIIHPDNGLRWIEVRSMPQRYPDGGTEWHGLMIDITERKRMEAELLSQADFQQTILNAVADAGMQVMMIEEGRIIHVGNRKLAYEFGFTDEELDAHPMLTEIVHPDDRDMVMEHYRRRMAGEAVPASYELGLVTRNGERREYETAVAIVPGTSPARVITVGKDIGERKRMETELLSQADFQQTLLNAIRDVGMQMLVIENGRMVYIGNRASALKFGFIDEEIAAHPSFIDFVHPDDRERVIGYHVSRQKGEAVPSSYELGLVNRNGERREFETSVAVVPGTDPVRTIAICKDITERKRTEHALAEREQELRALAESSPGMIFCYYLRPDGSMCMPYVSANIRELYGLRPEDVADSVDPLMALHHPADAERVAASIAESARTMTTWHAEFRILHPTRSERWMEGNSNPFPHPDGGIVWYGYVHDITERKQAEAEKQRLLNILEQSADFIGVADMQTHLLYHNPAALRMVGLAEDADLSAMRIADMHPAWAMEVIRQTAVPAVLEHGVWRGETALLHRNGREIPVSQLLMLHRDADGKPEYMSTIMQDITERKQAENEIRALNADLEQRVLERTEELRRQTNYLRTMIDTLPMMAWFKDTDSKYLIVNQDFAVAVAGTDDAAALTGKYDTDLWPGEYASAYRADDAEVMATRRRKTVEEVFIDANNDNVWIETFKAPVVDEDGSVLGTVGLARDISERKAVDAAREAALAEAERLARLRSEFMARMSHELRTPLNGILGYTQVLQGESKLDERHGVMVNVIQKSGEHLLSLINDILDFAKIEAGKQMLSLSDIHLPVFLGNIAGIVGVNSEQKQLAFVYEIAEDVPDGIRADEMRLRQVLLNLLSNAVKYTEQGKVSLMVTALEPGRLRFKVRDTGIGIDNGQLETIFRPFEQAGDSRNHNSGTGLGLVISRELVRLMGSEIFVTSRVGEGSCFWFDLDTPVVDIYREIMPAKQLASGYRGPGRRVLVVDDVEANRSVLVDMLSRLGFETLEVANGRECLDSVGRQMPDLVLLDMVMPEMDGLEAARCLRSLPGFGQTPIIAVSASASGTDVAEALAAGVNAFLSKPIELKRLMAQIGGLLNLDWIYALPEVELSPQHGFDQCFEVPPEEEMKVLHRMALEGSMRDIIRQAGYLEELDQRYRPFAGQLRKLSQDYQSKAVLDLVERYYQQE